MYKCHKIATAILILLGFCACNESAQKVSSEKDSIARTISSDSLITASAIKLRKTPTDFLPQGYIVFDTIYGDLNKDSLDDCVLIIKGTEKDKIVKDEMRGELDRNRRGILVLLNRNGNYELLLGNNSCFSSENEDGGIYYAPDLDFRIAKGNLYIHYAHGRYGYWSYTFRIAGSDMELIGYDASSNSGPVVDSETSINFLSKRICEKVNVNVNAESGEEVFEETWSDIQANQLIKLSEIRDFDNLELPQ